MSARGREWQRLGCAAFCGAILAFPAGVMLAGRDTKPSEASASRNDVVHQGPSIQARKPYAPDVLRDPFVLEQHRRVAEALETSCRETGKACVEARQARQYLSELEASP